MAARGPPEMAVPEEPVVVVRKVVMAGMVG